MTNPDHQRIEALGELARQQMPPEVPARQRQGHFIVPERGRRSPWLAIALAVIVALVSVGGYLFFQSRATPTPPIPDALNLDLTKTHLNCRPSVSWSPDGLSIAVTGGTNRCEEPEQIATTIFDARRGTVIHQIDISSVLGRKLNSSAANLARQPIWSPDGKTLFFALTLASSTTTSNGLLAVPLDSGNASLFGNTDAAANGLPIWDIQTGKIVTTLANPLPLALTYQWTDDGHFVAASPMPRSTGDTTFTGSPTSTGRQHVFSRWHSGTLNPILARDATGALSSDIQPVGWFTESYAPLWSPNGRYLIPLVETQTRLTPSTPLTAQQCDRGYSAVCATPAAPLPDRALATVLTRTAAGEPCHQQSCATSTRWGIVSIDWRPDGKVLAEVIATSETSSQVLNFLDTTTGASLKTLSLAAHPLGTLSNGVAITAWSPSGQQVALLSGNTLEIWGGASLTGLPPTAD